MSQGLGGLTNEKKKINGLLFLKCQRELRKYLKCQNALEIRYSDPKAPK